MRRAVRIAAERAESDEAAVGEKLRAYRASGRVAREAADAYLSQTAEEVSAWLEHGEDLCTSGIAWYEFLSGPVDAEGVDLMRAVIQDRVLPFAGDTASEAARLFNGCGRIRRLRVDAMIAASATMSENCNEDCTQMHADSRLYKQITTQVRHGHVRRRQFVVRADDVSLPCTIFVAVLVPSTRIRRCGSCRYRKP